MNQGNILPKVLQDMAPTKMVPTILTCEQKQSTCKSNKIPEAAELFFHTAKEEVHVKSEPEAEF